MGSVSDGLDNSDNLQPFLRWAGGKRWLAQLLKPIFIEVPIKCYFEPFLGSASIFFSFTTGQSHLSDLNGELIECYTEIKKRPLDVRNLLLSMENSPSNYYRVRGNVPDTSLERAVRMIYLNRYCFSGLYRRNQRGEFNVPYGGQDRGLGPFSIDGYIERVSHKLSQASLVEQDFEQALALAGNGDLVYCDPTFVVVGNKTNFVRYNEKVFGWEDQRRLAACTRQAADRGATCIVSNIADASIQKLYHPYRPFILSRRSSLGKASARGETKEYLFVITKIKNYRNIFRKHLPLC